ncbi:BREX-1 system adenine-specific DNA-methyltransferase PglX [Nibrella viscosa]|uniref:site-specific DNA-methyltransferase (adenine-specific) n=1 Tax=Nibrella viscosa TaxID=1084524 RepID=A0ABP8K0Y6_9BACT
MDTRRLKPFAQQARRLLMQGVAERLRYWGFVPDSRQPIETVDNIDGGYLFRGQVFDEADVPRRWKALAETVRKHGFAHVQEAVAYTWFNRLMALRILARNGYQPDVLAFTRPDTPTPVLLDEARRSRPPYLAEPAYRHLRPLLTDYTREAEAFARLLTVYCDQHRVLHRLFDQMDDAAALLLPANILSDGGFLSFLNKTDAIADDDYRQVELIGWLYQFYISERKDEVFAGFKKGQKAGPDDIPAATQIFTPRWIVSYLVENTLGRLYLDQNPDSPLADQMKYLVKGGEDHHVFPAFGEGVEALRLIDPACGSGHILVTAFDLLMLIYGEEGYTKRQAAERILRHHLTGLDLDERAAQLSRFALLLKAGQYHPGIWDTDIIPAVWAMPDPWMPTDADLLDFLGPDGREYFAELHNALRLMQDAQNLGSVMRPDLSAAGRAFLSERTRQYAGQTANPTSLFSAGERQRLLHYLHVLLTLTDRYAAVVANPPYLGQGNMNDELKLYVNRHFPRSKADLFAVFMEISERLCLHGGRWGMINQHSWMFLSSYEVLREHVLQSQVIESMLHLGIGTFEELNSKVIQSTAFTIFNNAPSATSSGTYYKLTELSNNSGKEKSFLSGTNKFLSVEQAYFPNIPSSPIAYWVSTKMLNTYGKGPLLKSVSSPCKGIDTGKNELFVRYWYEVDSNFCLFKNFNWDRINGYKWFPYNKGGERRKWFGNRENIVNWENNGESIKARLSRKTEKPSLRNLDKIFHPSFTWTTVSTVDFSCRYSPEGALFDSGGSSIFSNEQIFYSIGAFLNSKVAATFFKFLSPTLNFQPGDVGNLLWSDTTTLKNTIVQKAKNCISIARTDWDSRETSWDFTENPLIAVWRKLDEGQLPEAYDSWANEVARQFVQLHRHEEELNRIFIDLYGLQDELTPNVSPRDITLLPEELDKNRLDATVANGQWATDAEAAVRASLKPDAVVRQLISYAVGLLMGRYRLDKPGLHIAHPNPTAEELASYPVTWNTSHSHADVFAANSQATETSTVSITTTAAPGIGTPTAGTPAALSPYHSFIIDPDGILPLLGEEGGFADDAVRGVRQVLELIWGADNLTQTMSFVEDALGQSLDKYLTTQFWADHCRRYQKRPIYWLFSSPKGAFRALVYLHRMNAYTVATLRNKYLLPFIDRLKRQIDTLETAPDRLTTADLRRLDTLRRQYEECRQYDLLLKDAADRSFTPDLDAGVTRNYAELGNVLAVVK